MIDEEVCGWTDYHRYTATVKSDSASRVRRWREQPLSNSVVTFGSTNVGGAGK